MAHSGEIRRFEQLTGELPEQQRCANARLSRNPVWLLLQGLEDFDTERASGCLARLLANHYDNISVLKLATKRDLVVDAGILPGDALRIIAAAKEYDAPRDFGFEPTSRFGHGIQPTQGVARSQDMYPSPALHTTNFKFIPPWFRPTSLEVNLHSSAVMQQQQQIDVALREEAVKEGKVVDQVGLRQEPVVQDPTLPSLRGAFEGGRTGYAPADARFAPADPTLAPPWRALVNGKMGCTYNWNPVFNITHYNNPMPVVGSGSSFRPAPVIPGPPLSVKYAQRSPSTLQILPPDISYPHACRQRRKVAYEKAKWSAHTSKVDNCTVEETKKVPQPPVVVELKQPTQPERAAAELMQPVQSAPIAASVIAKGAARPPAVGELKEPPQPKQAASESMQPLQSSLVVASLIAEGVAQPPAVGELKQPPQPKKAASELMQPLQGSPAGTTLYACGVCNVHCGTQFDLRCHLNGNKHAKNMKRAVAADDNLPTQYLHCSICDVTCMCKKALVLHFVGKRHTRNMKPLVMHPNGKRHTENMKEKSDSGNSSYDSDTESSDC